jgi:hypothetical protein
VGGCSDLFGQSALHSPTIQESLFSVPLGDTIYEKNGTFSIRGNIIWTEYVCIKYIEVDHGRRAHADATGSNYTGDMAFYQRFTVLSKSIKTKTAVMV